LVAPVVAGRPSGLMSSSDDSEEESPQPQEKRRRNKSPKAAAAAAAPARAAAEEESESDEESDSDDSSSEESVDQKPPAKDTKKKGSTAAPTGKAESRAAAAAAVAAAGKAQKADGAAAKAADAKVAASKAADAKAPKADSSKSAAASLNVSTCTNKTISEIIHGKYNPHSTNHGKVVYKKEKPPGSSALDVLIYFWDDRDGPELCGWWFGPSVGGDMVWAYHPSRKATTPPAADWNVPHDREIDPHFSVTAVRADGTASGETPKKAKPAKEQAAAAMEADPPKKEGKAMAVEAKASSKKSEDKKKPKADEKAKKDKEKSHKKAKKREEEEEEDEDEDESDSSDDEDEEEEEEEEEEEAPAPKPAKPAEKKQKTSKDAEVGLEAKAQAKAAEEAAEAKADAKSKSKKKKKDDGVAMPHAEGLAARTRDAFIEAYNRRREEQAKAEGSKKQGEDPGEKQDVADAVAAAEKEAPKEVAKQSAKASAAKEEKAKKAKKGDSEKPAEKPKKEDKKADTKTKSDKKDKAKEKAKEKDKGKEKAKEEKEEKTKKDKGKEKAKEKDKDKDKDKDDGKAAKADDDDGKRRDDRKRDRDDDRRRGDDRHDNRRRDRDDPKRKDEDRRRDRDRDDDRRRRDRSEDRRRRDRSDDRRHRDASRSRDRDRRDDRRRGRDRDEDRRRGRDDDRKRDDDRRRKDSSSDSDRRGRRDDKKRKDDDKKRRKKDSSDSDDDSSSRKKAKAGASKEASSKKKAADAPQDEESKALRQQQATLAVLSCFQKLSDVSLDNFDTLKAEFDEVMKKDLPDTGAQMETLKGEAERVFGYAKQYIDQVREQQKSAGELKKSSDDDDKGKNDKDEEAATKKHKTEEEEKEDEARRERERKEEEEAAAKRKQKEEEERRREEERKRETPEEAAARREMEKKKKEEDMRRRELELQRRREERRKKEAEELEKLEERKRAEREVKRKEEEAKKEEDRKKKEELDKKKAEEEAAKRQAEAKVRREQQATLAVLRGFQKLSEANPDNFEALKAEFEHMLETDLPDTGAQKEVLKAEADRVFGYAKQYVEQARQQQKQAKEQEKMVLSILEEMQKLVADAEAMSDNACSLVKTLSSQQDLPDSDSLRIAQLAEQAGDKATELCTRCGECLEQQRARVLEAPALRQEAARVLAILPSRIFSANRHANEALDVAKTVRERITNKLALSVLGGRDAEMFKRYDKDGDGRLSRQEIAAYARAEFQLDIPVQTLDRMTRQLGDPSGKGVELSRFQRLKTAVGIARHQERGRVNSLPSEAREKVEAEKRAAREQRLSEKKTSLGKVLEGLLKSTGELDGKTQAVDKDAEDFTQKVVDRKETEIMDLVATVDASVQGALSDLAKLRTSVSNFRLELAKASEVTEALGPDFSRLGAEVKRLSERLVKAQSAIVDAKHGALSKSFDRFGALRREVAGKLRTCIEAKGGKAVDLFQAIAPEGADRIGPADVQRFLQANQAELEARKVEQVLAACARGFVPEGEDEASASEAVSSTCREDFMRLIRVYCKVTKDVVLTDNMAIEGSQQLRKLLPGEVVEIYQGPTPEPGSASLRVQGRALKDGAVGWATMSVSGGDTFLVPGGNLLRVARPCPITDESGDSSAARSSRTLCAGTLVEIMDWSRSALSSGSETRIRGRARGDKVAGWMPLADATGAAFLEAV